MAELQHCHTCRWGWYFEDEYKDAEDSVGECHRHAPLPVQNDDAYTYYTIWPRVHGSAGCGDWCSRFTDN